MFTFVNDTPAFINKAQELNAAFTFVNDTPAYINKTQELNAAFTFVNDTTAFINNYMSNKHGAGIYICGPSTYKQFN